jgi:hypothetical protein
LKKKERRENRERRESLRDKEVQERERESLWPILDTCAMFLAVQAVQ